MSDITGGDEVTTFTVKGVSDLDGVIRDLDRLEEKLDQVRKAAKELGSTKIGGQLDQVASQLESVRNATQSTGQVTSATQKAMASLDGTIGGLDKSVASMRKQMFGFTGDWKQNKTEAAAYKKQMEAVGMAVVGQSKDFAMWKKNVGGLWKNISDPTKTTLASIQSIKALDGGGPIFATPLNSAQQMSVKMQVLRKQTDSFFDHLQSRGKNLQWSGMQLIQGVSAPLAIAGTLAMNNWISVEKEMLQLKKVLEEFDNSKLEAVKKSIGDTATEFGISRKAATGLYRDIAALGVAPQGLEGWAKGISQIAMIGDMSTQGAMDFFRTVNAIFTSGSGPERLDQTNRLMEQFNAIADDTSLQLKDLAVAFPEVAPVMSQMGFSAESIAASLAGMYKAGIPATEGAHALKFAMARLINPTKDAQKAMDQLGWSFGKSSADVEKNFANLDTADKSMLSLAQNIRDKTSSGTEAMRKLSEMVGSRQAARMETYFKSMADGADEYMRAAEDGRVTADEAEQFQSDWARAMVASGKLVVEGMTDSATRYKQAVKAFEEDPTMAWARIKTQFQEVLYKIGAIIGPILIDWGQRLVGFLDRLTNMPAGILKLVGVFGAVVAAAGPFMYIFAQGMNTVSAFGKIIDKILPKMKGLATKADVLRSLEAGEGRQFAQVGDRFVDVTKRRRLSRFFGRKDKGNQVIDPDAANAKVLDKNMQSLAKSNADVAAAVTSATIAQNSQNLAMQVGAVNAERLAAVNEGIAMMPGRVGKNDLAAINDNITQSFDRSKRASMEAGATYSAWPRQAATELEGVANASDDVAAGMAKASKGGGLFSKLKGEGGGVLGIFGNMVGMFTKFNVITFAISALVGVVITLVGAFKEVKKYWDYIYSGLKPGIDAIKSAFGELLNAFKEIFGQMGEVIQSAFSGDGGAGGDPRATAMGIGTAFGSMAKAIAQAIRWVASLIKFLWPLFERTAFIIRDVIGFISALFSGDFTTAFRYAGALVYEFARPFLIAAQQIVGIMVSLNSSILSVLSSIANAFMAFMNWLGSIPIIGTVIKPVTSAISSGVGQLKGYFDTAKGYVDEFGKGVSGSIGAMDGYFRKGLNGTLKGGSSDVANAVDQWGQDNKDNAENTGEDLGNSLGDGVGKGAGDALADSQWFKDWLSRIKNRLDKAVDDIRTKAKQALDDYQQAVLDTYDARVKAIEETEAAEERLYKTEEYLAKKREMLRKRNIAMLNYQNNRALAIYEGRINDARMLDLEYQKDTEDYNQDLTDVETDRQRDLLKEQRDAMKEKINSEKDAQKKIFDIQKKGFEDQLALITEYAPRTVEEFDAMLGAINALLISNGVEAWPEMARNGMDRFREVFRQANEDIRQDFFWSGKDPMAEWMAKWIDPDAYKMLIDMAGSAGNSAGGAMGDGVVGGFDNAMEDMPPIPTPEVPSVDWGAKLSEWWNGFTTAFKNSMKFLLNWLSDNFFEPVWNSVAGWFNKIGGMLSGLTGGKIEIPEIPKVDFTIPMDLDMKSQVVDPVKQANVEIVDSAEKASDDMVKAYLESLSLTKTGVKDTSSTWLGANAGIKASTGEAMGSVSASTSSTLAGLVTYVDEYGNTWKKTTDGFVNQNGEAGNAIIDQSGRMTGIVNNNTGQISSKFAATTSDMNSKFSGTVVGVGFGATLMKGAIQDRTREGVETAKGHMGGLSGFFNTVASLIGGIWNGVRNTLAAPINIIGNPFSSILNKFREVIEKIWNALPSQLQEAVSFFGEGLRRLSGIRLAHGGIVDPIEGGLPAVIGEGGYREYVISTDPNMKKRSIGLISSLLGDMGLTGQAAKMAGGKMSVRLPNDAAISLSKTAASIGNAQRNGDTIIQVENFIGEEEWFKELMNKYDVKVAGPKRSATGQQKRVLSTYNDRYRVQP